MRFVGLAQRMAESVEVDKAEMSFGETTGTLRAGPVLCTTRLVEGAYPDYRAVLPGEVPGRAVVNRADMIDAVRRAAVVTSDNSRVVLLEIRPNAIAVSAESSERGRARAEIGAEFSGDPLEIRFNPDFLVEGMRASVAERISLHVSDPKSAARIDLGEGFLYVALPIRPREDS